MKSILENIDTLLLYRLKESLGFYPDKERAETAMEFLRDEIAEKLVAMLSSRDINQAADTYHYPEE